MNSQNFKIRQQKKKLQIPPHKNRIIRCIIFGALDILMSYIAVICSVKSALQSHDARI